MLRAVLAAIEGAGKPMCLADLSRDVGVDEPALEGMLETLVARGRLRTIALVDDRCGACAIKSGCFIMKDGVARTYALPRASLSSRSGLPLGHSPASWPDIDRG